jgi:hypothetical protein
MDRVYSLADQHFDFGKPVTAQASIESAAAIEKQVMRAS